MRLDIFEGSLQGKYLGTFDSEKRNPPKKGEMLSLLRRPVTRVKVEDCKPQRYPGYFAVIVKVLP